MAKRKNQPIKKSKDGIGRRSVWVEFRITPEEESMADLLYSDYRESAGMEDLTFQDYLAILLRRAMDAEINSRQGQAEQDAEDAYPDEVT